MKRSRTSTIPKENRIPYVAFQPRARARMYEGIRLITNIVRPTLGPVPRLVGIQPIDPDPGSKPPEILDNGGLIARRILALPNRDADVGAMFLRHVLWRQHERLGDGTATTAVLFDAVYRGGMRYLAAGGNAVRLRPHLEAGLRAVMNELEQRAQPLVGRQSIAQIAESIGHDPDLADTLGEIFDVVGEHGRVEVRSGRTYDVQREYVLGTYYQGKLATEHMVTDPSRMRGQVEDAAILLTDLVIEEPSAFLPLMRLAHDEGITSLMIIAREIAPAALAPLLAASRFPRPCRVVAVTFRDALSEQMNMLDDLAVLTGGRVFVKAAGDSLTAVKPQDLGQARRAWADKEYFGIVSGKGSPRATRAHLERLRDAIDKTDDLEARKRILNRIGRILGGTAVLWVGGISDSDIKTRKEQTERTIEAVRAALGKGLLPGGGVALLDCRATLKRLAHATDDGDARQAYRILARALEEPTRVLLRNAGHRPEPILARIDEAGAGHGMDVRTGQIVDMVAEGIVDSAGVLIGALHEAVASAALALTIDVVVHKKSPETSFEP